MSDLLENVSISPATRRVRVLAVVVLVGMFVGSHGPRIDSLEGTMEMGHGVGGIPLDKLVHFGAFSLMTWLMGMAKFVGKSSRLNLLAATLFACGYGAFDEVTQGMMGRDCELSDWLADAMAAWSVLLARWPGSAAGWVSGVRWAVCAAVCAAVPVRAFLSKIRGGPFSRDAIEHQQYFVLGGLVAVACAVMLVSVAKAGRRTA